MKGNCEHGMNISIIFVRRTRTDFVNGGGVGSLEPHCGIEVDIILSPGGGSQAQPRTK